MRFLGLGLTDRVPDAKTIWTFRERLCPELPWERDTATSVLRGDAACRHDGDEPEPQRDRPALGRHRSTVQRELARTRSADPGYRPDSVGRRAWARTLRGSRIMRSTHLRVHVEDRLAMGWSPEQIAGRMELGGPERRVSAESIYRHAYSRVGQGAGLPRLLAQHKPKRGRRRNGHCEHTQYGGGIHGRDCSDRGRSGEGGVPASRGHGGRDAGVPQEAVASAVSSVHVETSALPRRDGSLRLGTLLGPRDGGAWPPGPADPADLPWSSTPSSSGRSLASRCSPCCRW
jgi:hypothetical protein